MSFKSDPAQRLADLARSCDPNPGANPKFLNVATKTVEVLASLSPSLSTSASKASLKVVATLTEEFAEQQGRRLCITCDAEICL